MNINCIPVKKDGKIVCQRCGFLFDLTDDELQNPVYRNCIPIAVLPTATTRITNYVASTIRSAIHGFPRCEQDEIDARLKICQSCPIHQWIVKDEHSGYCALCGCCGNDGKSIFLNKLARRDEHCPAQLW